MLLVLALGVQLGRAIANLLAGAGWHLPPRIDLFNSLPAVLAGDPAAGLPAALTGDRLTGSAVGVHRASPTLVLLAGCVVLIKVGLDRWGPGRMKGMASRREAEQLLGLHPAPQERTHHPPRPPPKPTPMNTAR